MRRAKIVCTLGPSTNSYEAILGLMKKGMDVARLNCSHATHDLLTDLVTKVRKASEEHSRPVAILLDLQGPKLRIGKFPQGPVAIQEGDEIIITTEAQAEDTAQKISTNYEPLADDVRVGNRILIDDGNIELRVKAIRKPEVVCEVVHGGMLSSRKGLNLPGVKTSIPCLTEKDSSDLYHGLSLNVDYIALSFVRHPADVSTVQQMIRDQDKSTPVIAKIEKPEAVDCIDDIVAVADGIMVARGDMAVELSPQQVPSVQKRIIHKCNAAGIPVILATQMLESMVQHARPTRAEASDVANGVFDGADALMLSAESASGKYPFASVQIMTDIIGQAERDRESLIVRQLETPPVISVADAIEAAAAQIARHTEARAICCITNSGKGALALAKYRPPVPVFALTDRKEVLQRLSLIWGVKGILIPEITQMDNPYLFVEEKVATWWNQFLVPSHRPLVRGEYLVITVGLPTLNRTKTNTVKVNAISQDWGIAK